jgi:hypothetical protein
LVGGLIRTAAGITYLGITDRTATVTDWRKGVVDALSNDDIATRFLDVLELEAVTVAVGVGLALGVLSGVTGISGIEQPGGAGVTGNEGVLGCVGSEWHLEDARADDTELLTQESGVSGGHESDRRVLTVLTVVVL